MPAKVRFQGGVVAAIDDFEWTCEAHPWFAAALNAFRYRGERHVNLAISPDPDIEEAWRVAEWMDGEVFDHEPYNIWIPPGAVR